MATQVHDHQSPEWVKRMRERGFTVQEAKPGFVMPPFPERPREASPLVVLWRRATRRLRGKRALS
jgi:hypothetical protein